MRFFYCPKCASFVEPAEQTIGSVIGTCGNCQLTFDIDFSPVDAPFESTAKEMEQLGVPMTGCDKP